MKSFEQWQKNLETRLVAWLAGPKADPIAKPDKAEVNPLIERYTFQNGDEIRKNLLAFEHCDIGILKCPVCGDIYTHVQAAYTRCGSDRYEAIWAYPGTENRGSTDSRRSALCVLVEGESCGHRFEIIFQQHKGFTFVEVGIAQPRSAETLEGGAK